MDTLEDHGRPSPRPGLNVRDSNRLLAMLPTDERQQLLSSMVRRSFEPHDVVLKSAQPIHHVYFPLHGAASLVVSMRDGDMAAVCTVGNEGMLGLPLLHGAEQSDVTGIFHTPAEAMIMSAADFQAEVARGGALRQAVQQYAQGFLNHTCRLAACSRLHPVEQRFCRWMLMTHDRVGQDAVQVTQEFAAAMLGVRRATVNLVARALERSGLVEHHRGVIVVIDRQGLEARACECYAAIRTCYERALCKLAEGAGSSAPEVVVDTAGRVNTIVAPAPGGLSAQIRPPWASTIHREM